MRHAVYVYIQVTLFLGNLSKSVCGVGPTEQMDQGKITTSIGLRDLFIRMEFLLTLRFLRIGGLIIII